MLDIRKYIWIFLPCDSKIEPKTCDPTLYSFLIVWTILAMTYTQLLNNRNGEELNAAKHGLNRDAVRAALIGHQVGVVAVADGCGLTFWSEIAAHIAVNEFVVYCEKNLPKEAHFLPTAMKEFLRSAIHHVNQSMLNWKHPKTKYIF